MSEQQRQIAFARPCFGVEEQEAAARAIASGWVVGGPRLEELERQFATTCETAHAVGVSSWTTGAFLVLKALGIGPGDEVIVPSLTFIASVNVIVHAGATPVFADVDTATYNVDPADVAAKITARTKAILPVDQIGLPCEIDRLLAIAERAGLVVIQDAACSIGARFRDRPVGAVAPVTIFSLHARKVVTTGEGGMIVTNDEGFAARLRLLRHQAMSLSDFQRHTGAPTDFESYPEIGYNFRITDIQAAVGVVQMRKLDAMIARRHAIAERYTAAIADLPQFVAPYAPEHVVPNWQSYQVLVATGGRARRNAVLTGLHAAGIATRRGVMASHREPPYAPMGARLPRTEHVADHAFQLPIYPDLTDAEVERIIAALANLAA
ncbi:MAG: DegT/DnrJ/EryC1/StrS family aminotransferase [Hyphomicrobiaceae bacterium]|nr:DegT/DnrJ/EryC1/StrS family aminotransferase [Hyphomicrobiaceae bacterium]